MCYNVPNFDTDVCRRFSESSGLMAMPMAEQTDSGRGGNDPASACLERRGRAFGRPAISAKQARDAGFLFLILSVRSTRPEEIQLSLAREF